MTLKHWNHKPTAQMRKQRLREVKTLAPNRIVGSEPSLGGGIKADPSHSPPPPPTPPTPVCFLSISSGIRTTLSKAHGPLEDYISQFPLQLERSYVTLSWPMNEYNFWFTLFKGRRELVPSSSPFWE